MLLYWLLGIALVVVALLLFINSRPGECRFERSRVVKAPPAAIYPLINNMAASLTWNPFVKKDPNLKGELSGPAAGVGARYSFVGNSEVGTGNIEIISIEPDRQVDFVLRMIKPMKGENSVRFTLTPEADGSGTRVSWALFGKVPFIGKIFHLLMNVDKMMSASMDQGLGELAAMAETQAAA